MKRCSAISSIVCGSARKSSIASWRRGDDRGERVDQSQELVAALDDATVVERHVVAGVLVADLRQARLEVLEVAPHVAVVRAEAGEVDVGEEEHLAVDTEAAVAAGVAGEVHGLDGRAAEIEDVAVAEAGGIGARRVVEHLDDVLGERDGRVGSPYTAINPSRLWTPGRSSWCTCTRASANRPLPAMWSSWLWLLTTASTAAGAPPRATTLTDGSMMRVSARPRTSSELPDG